MLNCTCLALFNMPVFFTGMLFNSCTSNYTPLGLLTYPSVNNVQSHSGLMSTFLVSKILYQVVLVPTTNMDTKSDILKIHIKMTML